MNLSRSQALLDAEFARAFNLHRQGHVQAAEQNYRAILRSHPSHFGAASLLGLLFLHRGEAAEAEKQIRRALKTSSPGTKDPNVAEAYNNRGLALMQLDRFEDALASFESAITVRSDHIDARGNRAAALHELGRFEQAVAACDDVITLEPRYASVYNTRGMALNALHQFKEAISCFDRAIALQPDFHEAFYSRSNSHFLLEEFSQGWKDAEHRWHTSNFKGSAQAACVDVSVTRASLRDKRVLVVAEQGVGDEIMFASMIDDLLHDAKKVALECDRRLISLFGRSFPQVELIPRKNPVAWNAANFDCVAGALSLGRLYRNRHEDFPDRRSYLIHSPDIEEEWRARLSGLNGLKIGISWKGGVGAAQIRRSIALARLFDFFRVEGTRFVSLQYGQAKEEVDRANRQLQSPIVYFEPSQIEDFDQLAGLVCSLDLVITVQNSLVDLCGALGKRCLVFAPYDQIWRNGINGSKLPWYTSVQLYRQRRQEDWNEPVEQMLAALKAIVAAGRPPLICQIDP